MIKNYIFFGSVDWNLNWQTQHKLVNSLKKQGCSILYIENTGVRNVRLIDINRIFLRIKNRFKTINGFRQVDNNISILTPIIIPFHYNKLIQKINIFLFKYQLKNWIKVNNNYSYNLISFLATPLINSISDQLNPIMKIYYNGDNHALIANNRIYDLSEKEFVKKSNIVFTTSNKMKIKFQKYSNNVFKAESGIEIEKFNNKNKIPSEIKNISAPRVCYIGGLTNKIDKQLLKKISKLKKINFIFIGENKGYGTSYNEYKKNSNFYFLGHKKNTDLIKYLSNCEATMLPYKKNQFTDSIYPSKLNEYIASYKPIISTNIDEVIYFNNINNNPIYIASSHNQFINFLKNLNKLKINKKNYQKILKKNTWSQRFKKINFEINKYFINNKDLIFRSNKNFVDIIKKKINILKIRFLIFLTIFLIIFISPAPYYLNKALMVEEDKLKNFETLVIFSGHGYIGYKNNDYQIRIQDSIELSQSKNIKNIIIFGRKQLVDEALIIENFLTKKFFNDTNILIPKNNNKNTYENILSVLEILKVRNINSFFISTNNSHQLRVKKILEREKKGGKKFNYQFINSKKNNDEKYFFPLNKTLYTFYEYLALIYNKLKGFI